ncbi:MAG: response regulator transcription factor [Candidatus Tectomicrobia bacterium]|nr:response regulator transcription factor [Candidatus Tectomicrobia bacterium]
MCLPIRPQELRLRVRNLLGPSLYGPLRQPSAGSSSAGRRKRRAGLELDEERYEISLDGEPLSLTFREYELLKYLMTHPGRTFTREHLLTRVWGEDYLGGTRTVDVHVRRLRMKVEAGGRACIRTVRSVGYKFVG